MHTEPESDSIIICRSCGADYAAELPNCPYCGTMNLPAAETAYMKKLEHMRHGLEDLEGLAGREAKKGFRTMRRNIGLAAVLLLFVTALIFGIHIYQARAESRKEREEYLWQREAFAAMDEYYASGDYASLLAFYREAQDSGHHLWQYKHSAFCSFLITIEDAQRTLSDYEAGQADPVWLFREEISLYGLDYLNPLSREELEILTWLRSPLLEDFEARFPLTEEELSDFRKILSKGGYISYAECEQFLEEKGMGT